jgi:hypothetical protein
VVARRELKDVSKTLDAGLVLIGRVFGGKAAVMAERREDVGERNTFKGEFWRKEDWGTDFRVVSLHYYY